MCVCVCVCVCVCACVCERERERDICVQWREGAVAYPGFDVGGGGLYSMHENSYDPDSFHTV